MKGKVIHYQSLATWVWVFLVVVIVLLALIMTAYVKFSDRVTVSGYVRLEPDTIKILSGINGVVTELNVSEGFVLEANFPMVKVTSLAGLVKSKNSSYKRKVDLIQEDISNFNERRELLLRKISYAEDHLNGLNDFYAELHEELDEKVQNEVGNLDKGLAVLKELRSLESKKLLSKIEFYSHEQDMTNQLSKVLDSKIRIKELRKIIEDNKRKLQGELIDLRLKIYDEDQKVNNLKQRIIDLNSENIHSSYSPYVARVVSVNVSKGQSVQAGQKLLSLSSVNARMVVELALDSTSVGAVSVGDEVNIRFDSFPYQTHGFQKGRIIKVDSEVQSPDNIKFKPFINNKFAFLAIVEITDLRSELTGDDLSVKSGMTVRAEVLLEKRSVLSWVLGRQ